MSTLLCVEETPERRVIEVYPYAGKLPRVWVVQDRQAATLTVQTPDGDPVALTPDVVDALLPALKYFSGHGDLLVAFTTPEE